jgi:hypothetical protein
MKNKLILFVLFAATLPIRAGAGGVGGAREISVQADLKTWAWPIAQVFVQMGTDKFAMEQGPLHVLSLRAEDNFRNEMMSKDVIVDEPISWSGFQRFADALQVQMNPEEFKALKSNEEKIAVFRQAALLSGSRMRQDVERLFSATSQEMDLKSARRFENEKTALSREGFYMDDEGRMKLGQVESKLKVFEDKHKKEMEAWLAGLAQAVHDGLLEGADVFAQIQKPGQPVKWSLNSQEPDIYYPTLAEAIRARADQIKNMPEGPWKLDLFRSLTRVLADNPALEEQAAREGLDVPAFMARLDDEYERLEKELSINSDQYRLSPFSRVRRDLAKMETSGKTPAIPSVGAMFFRYSDFSQDSGYYSGEAKWVMAKAFAEGRSINKGSVNAVEGYPSYDKLRQAGRRALKRAYFSAGTILAALAAAAGTSVYNSYVLSLGPLGLLLIAGIAAAVLWNKPGGMAYRVWIASIKSKDGNAIERLISAYRSATQTTA